MRNILLVEDEKMIRYGIYVMIENSGVPYKAITECRNGREAVTCLSKELPLTIAGADKQKGTITLVVQKVGLSSTRLCQLNVGDCITDVVGPLGKATHIERYGTVVCAGGGVGVAPMLPIIQALKEAGNRVISVLAGRSKELIILEDEVRKSSDEVIIMTDDGSYGTKGLVTEGIEQVIRRE